VVCIASAIEGEDPTYLHAIRAVRAYHAKNGLEMPLFVYVPRRPERFDDIDEYLRKEGLSVLRRSSLEGAFDPRNWRQVRCPDIFLGDSLGEMYAYLAMCDEVVVGGGFNPKGAHNISEALALGKPVVTGPYTQTIEYPFVEAANAKVAYSVPDGKALGDHLIASASQNHTEIFTKQSAIEDFFISHSGAVERTLAALDGICRKGDVLE
jgi:3-deoxy-D-manno-octulosonic-acid transferase